MSSSSRHSGSRGTHGGARPLSGPRPKDAPPKTVRVRVSPPDLPGIVAGPSAPADIQRDDEDQKELVNAAVKQYGADDPITRLCLGTLIRAARGEYLGPKGRHIKTAISSVNSLLDRTHGRSRERDPFAGNDKNSDVDKVLAHLLKGPVDD